METATRRLDRHDKERIAMIMEKLSELEKNLVLCSCYIS